MSPVSKVKRSTILVVIPIPGRPWMDEYLFKIYLAVVCSALTESGTWPHSLECFGGKLKWCFFSSELDRRKAWAWFLPQHLRCLALKWQTIRAVTLKSLPCPADISRASHVAEQSISSSVAVLRSKHLERPFGASCKMTAELVFCLGLLAFFPLVGETLSSSYVN